MAPDPSRAAGPIRLRVVVHDDAKPVLRRVRRNVRERTAKTVRGLGERVVLPTARRRGRLGPFTSALVVKARGTTAYLTGVNAKQGRKIGLLEFGGVRRDVIRPKRGHRAVMTPMGPRAGVFAPRRYKRRGLITRAVEETFPRFERELGNAILDEFDPLEHQSFSGAEGTTSYRVQQG